MASTSSTHLVLIPSYNTGSKLLETVRDALEYWKPVWVVIDGSTDGSARELETVVEGITHFRKLSLFRNSGKGAAILYGLREAAACGFTHVLTMDADGQHPAPSIPNFMITSIANPDAMILGAPVFDATAPRIRVEGRKLSNGCVDLETLWAGIDDSLFGFRVYPIADLLCVMDGTRWMRRFDFDAEAVVRLSWRGLRAINIPVPTKYFRPEEGGVSHFNYFRDNVLLTWMHFRLFLEFLLRLPILVLRKIRSWRR